jgi:hypothetical protein
MSSKKYIPGSDAAFLVWVKNLLAYIMLHFAGWKVSEPDNSINVQVSEFEQALERAQAANRGKVDVVVKNEKRKTLEKSVRTYVQGFLARNPYVTVADREEMKLNVYDNVATPVSEPKVRAMGKIVYKGAGLIELHITPEADISEDKRAYYGCKILSKVTAADAPAPQNETELTESRFTRRKKEIFIFQPKDAAKRIYFSMRYENSKGQTGPWCPIFTAVIP